MKGYHGESRASFPPTQWSMVRSAVQGSTEAMEKLAKKYANAVYAYFRRDGHDPERAADLTQDFFAEYILDPERRKGVLKEKEEIDSRFRTYLRKCLKHFAMNARKKEQAVKRGGKKQPLSLDVDLLERKIASSSEEDPAREFDRQWAQETVEQVLRVLMKELDAKPLQIFKLTVRRMTDSQIAHELKMNAAAVGKARQRVFSRAREILHEELQDTVETADQLREELTELGRVYSLPSWISQDS